MQRYIVVETKAGFIVQDTLTYQVKVCYNNKVKADEVAAKLNAPKKG